MQTRLCWRGWCRPPQARNSISRDSSAVDAGVTRLRERRLHCACQGRSWAQVTGRNGRTKMAAEKASGKAPSWGSCSTKAMERVLPMLLVPVPAEATGRLGSRAKLHREQEVLGSLTAAGCLQVLSLAPGGRSGGACCLSGPFRQ